MSLHKILIIDDESSIRRVLRMNLEPKGFELQEAGTAQEGIQKIAAFKPNLIILDLGLPDKNGLAVLQEIRGWSKVPIIILTVSDEEDSKVKLLEAGADDYITKPFSIPELVARINVAFRHQREDIEATPILELEDLKIDLTKREIFVKGQKVHLTMTELNLLRALSKGHGQVVAQEQILKEVWGPNALNNPHYLRIYIGQLRKKLELDPSNPKHILTEPGVGYRIV